jgi:hypothetical protein
LPEQLGEGRCREGVDYRSSNADSREETHRNHKVLLRGPETRRKTWMKSRGAAPVVYGDAVLAFLIRGLHDLGSPKKCIFSLRLEACSNASITNLAENV